MDSLEQRVYIIQQLKKTGRLNRNYYGVWGGGRDVFKDGKLNVYKLRKLAKVQALSPTVPESIKSVVRVRSNDTTFPFLLLTTPDDFTTCTQSKVKQLIPLNLGLHPRKPGKKRHIAGDETGAIGDDRSQSADEEPSDAETLGEEKLSEDDEQPNSDDDDFIREGDSSSSSSSSSGSGSGSGSGSSSDEGGKPPPVVSTGGRLMRKCPHGGEPPAPEAQLDDDDDSEGVGRKRFFSDSED